VWVRISYLNLCGQNHAIFSSVDTSAYSYERNFSLNYGRNFFGDLNVTALDTRCLSVSIAGDDHSQ